MLAASRCLVVVLASSACSFEHGSAASDASPMTDGTADGAPDTLSGGCRVVELAASGAHTCARKTDGSVWLGRTARARSRSPSLRAIPARSVRTATRASCRRYARILRNRLSRSAPAINTSCALSAAHAFCWGANDGGQFGNGMAGDSATPVEIAARAGSTIISGSDASTCSLVAAMSNARGPTTTARSATTRRT